MIFGEILGININLPQSIQYIKEDEDYTLGNDEGSSDDITSDDPDDEDEDTSDTTSDDEDYTMGNSEDETEEEPTDEDETEEESEEPAEENEDFTMDGEDASGEDTNSEEETPEDDSGEEDTSEDDSMSEDDTESIDNELAEKEKELFAKLSPQEMDIKNAELKNNYDNMYKAIDNIRAKIQTIPSNKRIQNVLDFIINKLVETQDEIDHYMYHTYANKTYIQNLKQYNFYLLILKNIEKLFIEIAPKSNI